MVHDFGLDRRSVIAGITALMVAGRSAAGEAPAIIARLVVEDNRLWVAATIAGSAPMMFIVDTGAARNFIRPEVARQLRLPSVGGRMVKGIGGRSAATATVAARDVVVGAAMRQSEMLFDTYNFGAGIPADAAGLLAAGLFTKYDCDLDFVAGTWRVWPEGRVGDPAGSPLAGASLRATGRTSKEIQAVVQIDGKPYRLALDTGYPGTLLLAPRAAARMGLFETAAFAPTVTAGFGGTSNRLSRLIRAGRLEFGPLVLNRPFVTLMDPRQTSSMDVDGLIGLSLIQRLDLSIDATHNRIFAARNKRPPTVPGYNFSGLWFTESPRGVVVDTVGRGSPAERADIREGDVVVGSGQLSEVLARTRGDTGKAVELMVQRGGRSEAKRFVLAPYL